MKKILFCVLALLLVFSATAFADRNAIEEVIQAYESVVVEAETIANMPLIDPNDISALEERAADADPRVQAIADEREWVIQDARRLVELNVRFNQAMTSIALKLLQY